MVEWDEGVNSEKYLVSNVRFGSLAAPRNPTSSMAAFGGKADTHDSATFLVIIHDCSASRPNIGLIRLAAHNL